MKWLEGLNESQRQAVTATAGPVMIMAGPGTGKTRTLTARAAWLLARGVPASEILALTFTHKAAREMKERLAGLAAGSEELPEITTFHGYGYGLLQRTGDEDVRQFVSDSERLEVVRELKKAAGVKDLSARELALRLSRQKNASDSDDAAMAILARRYTEELRARGWRDFDDLIVEVLERLNGEPAAATYLHVLVDEFQDTSPVQYQIAKRLARDGAMFVIGDANQSIYGFRGASGAVFSEFEQDFPAALVIRLRSNYRSAKSVVEVGNAVFGSAATLRADGPERIGECGWSKR